MVRFVFGWHLPRVAHCDSSKITDVFFVFECYGFIVVICQFQSWFKWLCDAFLASKLCQSDCLRADSRWRVPLCCLSEVHAHWQFSCKDNLWGKTGAKFHAQWVQTLLNASLLTGWIACRCSSIHRVDLHIQTDYAKEEEEGKKSFGEQTFDFAFEGCYRKPKTTAQLFTLITEFATRSNRKMSHRWENITLKHTQT